jgi:hypothetical protein
VPRIEFYFIGLKIELRRDELGMQNEILLLKIKKSIYFVFLLAWLREVKYLREEYLNWKEWVVRFSGPLGRRTVSPN